MSSRSVDIINNNIMALTNTSKYNSFIFDIELDVSYTADSAWYYYYNDFFYKTLSMTIACQIGHKYKQWKVSSGVIACRLHDEFSSLKLSYTTWKGIISVAGQYVDQDSVSGYSEMIYDWFTYDGCLTPPKTYNQSGAVNVSDVYLQYTIRFVLSPALSGAQHLYSTRGYKKISKSRLLSGTTKYQKMMAQMDQKKEYNHLEVWQATLS
ncbi:hypothetical protein PV326_007612 [Microctonus aethiopoides]|nr:hypothetical protein PV326_007612 [Microctonus aethiopoides]